MTEPHGIEVTHTPLDAPGIRIAGSIAGEDVNLTYLTEFLSQVEDDISKTDAALADPKLRDLAEAVRGALLGVQAISYHLLEVHEGISRGSLNYAEEPLEARNRASV